LILTDLHLFCPSAQEAHRSLSRFFLFQQVLSYNPNCYQENTGRIPSYSLPGNDVIQRHTGLRPGPPRLFRCSARSGIRNPSTSAHAKPRRRSPSSSERLFHDRRLLASGEFALTPSHHPRSPRRRSKCSRLGDDSGYSPTLAPADWQIPVAALACSTCRSVLPTHPAAGVYCCIESVFRPRKTRDEPTPGRQQSEHTPSQSALVRVPSPFELGNQDQEAIGSPRGPRHRPNLTPHSLGALSAELRSPPGISATSGSLAATRRSRSILRPRVGPAARSVEPH
jgi:hypothetical protein